MKQKAYDVVDSVFESFLANNTRWINEMQCGEILNVDSISDLCYLQLMEEPWYVQYVAKVNGAEGSHILFLTSGFDKLYSIYNVQ